MSRSISTCLTFLMFLAAGSQILAQPLNIGREFYLSFPANWDYAVPDKHVRLYITSNLVTEVTVHGGPTLIATKTTIPNSIITVDIPLHLAQPVVRNDAAPIPPDQVYPNKAVRIASDDPIVVYGINRVTYTTDGVLALPTSALGSEYIIASAPDITDHNSQKLPSQYVITAPHDNTVVTIVNSWDTYGHVAGEMVTVTMNKGDVYSAMGKGTLSDLTGTVITSSRPVAVLAGQNCTYLPDRRYAACDHLVEMMTPVTSWGKVYHLVPFHNRLKGDFIRVFSGAPNTSIKINGDRTVVLPGKGGPGGSGWFTLLEPDRLLLEFISANPIAVAQYNNSQQYDNVTSDPFFLMLMPLEQYQTEYSFSTPGTDYSQNFINLAMDSSGWSSMEISEGGSTVWKKLNTNPAIVPQNFPTLIDGVRYSGVSFEIPHGAFRLRSEKPFAGYIYGWNPYDSYGYPLGAMVANISEDDSNAPLISATEDRSGNVTIVATDMPEEANRRTELSTIELDPASYNFTFDQRPMFDPAESRSASFRLKVIDPASDAWAVLVVSDMRGNISRDTFSYNASSMILSESVVDFGLMNINTTPHPTRDIVLRNIDNRPAPIDKVVLGNGARGFRVLAPTGAFELAAAGSAGDTRIITIEFVPTLAGEFADSIGVRDESGLRILGVLHAKVGTPRISVEDIDFGEWTVGDQAKENSFKIRNSSTDGGVLIVTGIAVGIPLQGTTFITPDSFPPFPLTLRAGEESAPIRVSFDPAMPIPYSDEIRFIHNAGADPANDSVAVLSGQGRMTSDVAQTENIPGLSLGPVAPTPAVDWTTLSYQVPAMSSVEITLVDATGRTVATLLEKSATAAGSHTLRFDLSALPAGSYFCRMSVGERVLMQPMVVR